MSNWTQFGHLVPPDNWLAISRRKMMFQLRRIGNAIVKSAFKRLIAPGEAPSPIIDRLADKTDILPLPG
jgi:hypothetical protein